MRKTFKYRLYPTKDQRTKLNSTLENCRLIYNKTLAIRKDTYEATGKAISLYDTNKLLPIWKEESPQFKTVYSHSLQNVQLRVDLAFKAFFSRVKSGETPGYPRFKSFGRYDSFSFKENNSGFKLINEDKRLRLSKIGDVKIKLHRPIEGKIKTLTIRRDRLNNWYACFSVVIECKPLPIVESMVGVDLGLTRFATLSNGEVVKRERWVKTDEKDLKRVQRKVSSLPKGSKERKKAVLALNHVHQRIANRRKNFIHQFTRKIVNNHQIIAFEDLNIKDMQQNGNKTINKGFADVALGETLNIASFKAECAGRTFIKVNPAYTSQTCRKCGFVSRENRKSQAKFLCIKCGHSENADLNASINILTRGLASLSRLSTVEAQ